MLKILFIFLPTLRASEIKYTIYSNSSKLLPEPVKEVDFVQIFLHLNDSSRHQLRTNDLDALLKSGYNFNVSTKVIIHGWISSANTLRGLTKLRDAYLGKTKYNVLEVNWTQLANGQYKIARESSGIVLKVVKEFIRFLVSVGVSTRQLHILGHCIGAHIAGSIGKYFRERENMLLDAITGLDPAYPGYKFCSRDQILTKYDARYVEVVLTNLGYWGFGSPLGQVDFYINGGRNQPGCKHDKTEKCAHDRAVWYYAYTIIECPFPAIQIYFREDSVWVYGKEYVINLDGLNLNYGREGLFYMLTEKDEPFIIYPNNEVDIVEPTARPFYFQDNNIL